VPKGRRKSVLCIGNDPVRLNLRCSYLRKNGWRALSSGSGYEGLIQLGGEAIDAVVLDLNDDGTETALIAGEAKRMRPSVAVVVLASDKGRLAEDAVRLADAIVLKSEEPGNILEVLEALGKKP